MSYMMVSSRCRILVLVAVLILCFLPYYNYNSSLPDLVPDEEEVQPAKILLVSAFYPLSKSKHSTEEYSAWMSKYLSKISTHIYFFAPPAMESVIRRLRGDLPMTLNTTYSSPYDIPPLVGMREIYESMHALDPEKKIHSPELYAVWTSKTFFLDEGLRNTEKSGTKYDYAFWNDAGSFRDDQEFDKWPGPYKIPSIFEAGSRLTGTPREDLIFMPIWESPPLSMRYWKEEDGPINTRSPISEGSFFGGQADAISWWRKTYFAYHDYYIFKLGKFAGKDQTVFTTLFLLFPGRFITVWQYDRQSPQYVGLGEGPLGSCGGTWWYYQFFVSDRSEQEKMRDIWTPDRHVPTSKWRSKFKTSRVCRMTRVLPIRNILDRAFGGYWMPPKATVDTGRSQRS